MTIGGSLAAARGLARATRIAALAAAAALELLGARPAGCAPPAGEPSNLAPTAEHELSLQQVVALAQKRYGARVVRAESAEQGGQHIYVLRLLSPGGKVWVVRLDARSGLELP